MPAVDNITPEVVAATSADLVQAKALALDTGLPLATGPPSSPVILQVGADRLELRKPGDPHLGGPVFVDFLSQPAIGRRKNVRSELLVRAVLVKKGAPPRVIDAAAGLGRDGFLLAAAGCSVLMIERNPAIHALLADGLRRAALHPATRDICRRITLVRDDFRVLIPEEEPEVVYLDPMFPGRVGNARVKKELQMLQIVTGPADDEPALLARASALCRKKVVVKRPLPAPALAGEQPDYSLRGKIVRFDVYLKPA